MIFGLLHDCYSLSSERWQRLDRNQFSVTSEDVTDLAAQMARGLP